MYITKQEAKDLYWHWNNIEEGSLRLYTDEIELEELSDGSIVWYSLGDNSVTGFITDLVSTTPISLAEYVTTLEPRDSWRQ